jgi:hypothetical protein
MPIPRHGCSRARKLMTSARYKDRLAASLSNALHIGQDSAEAADFVPASRPYPEGSPRTGLCLRPARARKSPWSIGVTPGHDILGRSRHDGDEESNARIKLTSALSPPSSCLLTFSRHLDAIFPRIGHDDASQARRAKTPDLTASWYGRNPAGGNSDGTATAKTPSCHRQWSYAY